MHEKALPFVPGACFYCGGAACNSFNDQGKPCHANCHGMGRKMRRAIAKGKMRRKR